MHDFITTFLNSKDVADHLQSIQYAYTAREAAYIVHKAKTRTFHEKMEAWARILQELPDDDTHIHRRLKAYMDLQLRKIQGFYDGTRAVYAYCVRYQGDPESEEQGAYTDYSACQKALQAELADMKNEAVDYIVITRRTLNQANSEYTAIFNGKMALCRILQYRLSDKDYKIDALFDNMWFHFPTPFKKGDILVQPYDHNPNPFVLTALNTDFADRLLLHGDDTDMGYAGYYVADGQFYGENGGDYLNLEFYRKPLYGAQRFLTVVRLFLLGKCNLEFLCQAKQYLDTERALREICFNANDALLKEVGILEEDDLYLKYKNSRTDDAPYRKLIRAIFGNCAAKLTLFDVDDLEHYIAGVMKSFPTRQEQAFFETFFLNQHKAGADVGKVLRRLRQPRYTRVLQQNFFEFEDLLPDEAATHGPFQSVEEMDEYILQHSDQEADDGVRRAAVDHCMTCGHPFTQYFTRLLHCEAAQRPGILTEMQGLWDQVKYAVIDAHNRLIPNDFLLDCFFRCGSDFDTVVGAENEQLYTLFILELLRNRETPLSAVYEKVIGT